MLLWTQRQSGINWKVINVEYTLKWYIDCLVESTQYISDVFFAFTNIGLTDVTPILVEAQYMPPINMEGRSVLYVLHIYNRKYGGTFASTSPNSGIIDMLYVGETESLAQRLTQHRVSWKVYISKKILIEYIRHQILIIISYLIGLFYTCSSSLDG